MKKEDAEDFFAEIFYGKHHIPSELKPWGDGWQLNYYGDFTTFDFNNLTRAVFLAHDRCIRFGITSSGPRMIRLVIHQRNKRIGSVMERHPTIEEALADWRIKHPADTIKWG
jgi:hypothetical protein